MKQLTAIILNKNSKATLNSVLEKLSFVQEIIILDDFSTDDCLSTVAKYHPRIIQHSLNNDFAAQRNFALLQSKTDWVLFLDSDEILSEGLIKEIINLPENPDISAYYFQRRDFFWQKPLYFGENGKSFFPRLVHKNRGSFQRAVHEEWQTNQKIQKLHNMLNHYPHQTVGEFLAEINFYSTINAGVFLSTGKKTNALDILLTPFGKFIYTYFFKLGLLDGAAGFVYSFMMSFHSFLTRSKLYLLSNK